MLGDLSGVVLEGFDSSAEGGDFGGGGELFGWISDDWSCLHVFDFLGGRVGLVGLVGPGGRDLFVPFGASELNRPGGGRVGLLNTQRHPACRRFQLFFPTVSMADGYGPHG